MLIRTQAVTGAGVGVEEHCAQPAGAQPRAPWNLVRTAAESKVLGKTEEAPASSTQTGDCKVQVSREAADCPTGGQGLVHTERSMVSTWPCPLHTPAKTNM